MSLWLRVCQSTWLLTPYLLALSSVLHNRAGCCGRELYVTTGATRILVYSVTIPVPSEMTLKEDVHIMQQEALVLNSSPIMSPSIPLVAPSVGLIPVSQSMMQLACSLAPGGVALSSWL